MIGVILAGGLSRRMGDKEKNLLPLGGASMIERVRERLVSQVGKIIVNANGDPHRFAFMNIPIQADVIEGFAGPLAGIHAGMVWAIKHESEATHIVTVAADTPFFPLDLVRKLIAQAHRPDRIVLAASGGFRHPVFGLWPVALSVELEHFLRSGEEPKVMRFVGRYPNEQVDFAMNEVRGETLDPFFNVNTPQDLEKANKMLSRAGNDA